MGYFAISTWEASGRSYSRTKLFAVVLLSGPQTILGHILVHVGTMGTTLRTGEINSLSHTQKVLLL